MQIAQGWDTIQTSLFHLSKPQRRPDLPQSPLPNADHLVLTVRTHQERGTPRSMTIMRTSCRIASPLSSPYAQPSTAASRTKAGRSPTTAHMRAPATTGPLQPCVHYLTDADNTDAYPLEKISTARPTPLTATITRPCPYDTGVYVPNASGAGTGRTSSASP